MNKSLLVLGAGQYGTVVKEIAEAMGCFDNINFLDDTFGMGVNEGNYHEQSIGKLADLEKFSQDYTYAIAAMGDVQLRQIWTDKALENCYQIPIIVSPMAFVSKSAQLLPGDVIEPFAVVHANAAIGKATYVSAGAIVNHNSFVSDYCHINCNAVVMSGAIVAPHTLVQPCEVVRAGLAQCMLKKTDRQ